MCSWQQEAATMQMQHISTDMDFNTIGPASSNGPVEWSTGSFGEQPRHSQDQALGVGPVAAMDDQPLSYHNFNEFEFDEDETTPLKMEVELDETSNGLLFVALEKLSATDFYQSNILRVHFINHPIHVCFLNACLSWAR